MIFLLLKFILTVGVYLGMVKIYLETPIFHNNPVVSLAGLAVLVIAFLFIFPSLLGMVIKFALIGVILGGIMYYLSNNGIDVTSLLSSKKTKIEELTNWADENILQSAEDMLKTALQDKTPIAGVATSTLNGSTLKVNNAPIQLYGVDAPAVAQTCLDLYGKKYDCGLQSRDVLRRLTQNKEVVCTPKKTSSGIIKAKCMLGNVDIASQMVSYGWAVADRSESSDYIAIEKKAHDRKLGLWNGKFVAPWDWRAKHRRQEPKQEKKGFMDWLNEKIRGE